MYMKRTHHNALVRMSRYAKGGFTLIETLVAVVIFTTSLAALLLVAGRGVAGATSAREDMVARLLAMEGMEVARNVRDSNMISGTNLSWDNGLSQCSNGCDVDYSGQSPFLDPAANGQPLWVNPVPGGLVAYSTATTSATATPYYRTVKITNDPALPDELRVVSTVSWDSRNRPRSVQYTTYLNRWFQPAPPTAP